VENDYSRSEYRIGSWRGRRDGRRYVFANGYGTNYIVGETGTESIPPS